MVLPLYLICHRTLLALGCHVGMGDEKAEENLKKIKLPKTYVIHDTSVCMNQPSSFSLYTSKCGIWSLL